MTNRQDEMLAELRTLKAMMNRQIYSNAVLLAVIDILIETTSSREAVLRYLRAMSAIFDDQVIPIDPTTRRIERMIGNLASKDEMKKAVDLVEKMLRDRQLSG